MKRFALVGFPDGLANQDISLLDLLSKINFNENFYNELYLLEHV
jgi:hypothetical protein